MSIRLQNVRRKILLKQMEKKFRIHASKEQFDLELSNENIFYKGEKLAIDLRKYSENTFHFIYKGKSYHLEVQPTADKKVFEVMINGRKITTSSQTSLDLLLDKLGYKGSNSTKMDDLKAPMPGLIIELPLVPGDTFEKGDSLIVLEAMKMENIIKASAAGIVKEVCVTQGEKVEKGQVLLKFD